MRSWQTKDGLPQNTVYALLQTSDGYLWVGTDGGLARFDGAEFRQFGLQDGLKSVSISSLAEDAQGTLWVGARAGGLSRWEAGRFSTISSAEGFPSTSVEHLAAGKDGTLWIGTSQGLAVWRGGTYSRLGPEKGLPQFHVRALLVDPTGWVWVSFTEGGLYKGNQNGFDRIQAISSAPTPVYSLCAGGDGVVWAGGGNGYLWKLANGVCQRFERTNGVPFQLIECLAQAPQGALWLGTRNGGLYEFNNGAFCQVPADAGLRGASVRALVVDHEGAVWAGTAAGGLNRLTPRLLKTWGRAEGLENQAVTSAAEDVSGFLWASTQNGGIYRFQENRFVRVNETPNYAKFPGAYTTLATADGTLWVGGESFLFCFHQGRPVQACLEEPIRSEALRAMCEDDRGIWIGTYYSTLLRADASGVKVVMTNVSPAGDIRCLARSGPDAVWIGTAAGLYQWRQGRVQSWGTQEGLLSATIQALYQDPDGTLWIGTQGGGLARLKAGQILNITSRQGLRDDVVSQIVQDDFGRLWLGCNRGIMCIERKELEDFTQGKTESVRAALLGRNEGMVNEQCSSGHSPTALRTRAGRLFFPTSEGLVEIDPREVVESTAPVPQPSIEEVRVDGEAQPRATTLVIGPGPRHVAISYAAPSLRGADQVHFRFRLAPFESEWTFAGTRRITYYTRLPPGHYEFQLGASVNQRDWNRQPSTLAVTVRPYYWQTLWFRILAAAGLCALSFGWYTRRLKRLEARRLAQETFTRQLLLSQENERKRIAAELHDGLGQDLLLIKNRVGLLSASKQHSPEITRQLAEISTNATRAITDVRAISQALRPSALEQVGLTKAIEWMVRQTAEASTAKFSTDLENIDGLVGADMEINVYRILQEGLNNVLKHSGASRVIVELKRDPEGIIASIFDDGRGFEPETLKQNGNGQPSFGLTGMRERAHVLGGSIEVLSAQGKGTRLILKVPIPTPTK